MNLPASFSLLFLGFQLAEFDIRLYFKRYRSFHINSIGEMQPCRELTWEIFLREHLLLPYTCFFDQNSLLVFPKKASKNTLSSLMEMSTRYVEVQEREDSVCNLYFYGSFINESSCFRFYKLLLKKIINIYGLQQRNQKFFSFFQNVSFAFFYKMKTSKVCHFFKRGSPSVQVIFFSFCYRAKA